MSNDIDPKDILPFLINITATAGKTIMSYFEGQYTVERKNVELSSIDIVTDADRESERIIVEAISSEFPDHDIITEESEPLEKGSSWKWFVDPLDGTINFAHGFPMFCVSVALMKDDRLIAGIVHDPLRSESFTASVGGGAFLNGKQIHVSSSERLQTSIVATGFPYDRSTSPKNNLAEFSRIMPNLQGIRRAGSAALDLAYVAAGRLDGFWELKLKPWDMAAGIRLVQEAGGRISNRTGESTNVYTDCVVATNGKIHDTLVGLLSSAE